MFIISLTYKVQLSQVEKYLNEHKAFLKKYYDNGLFVMSGAKVPREGGIIIASVLNKAILEEVIQEDPFNIHGISDYEIFEFKPSLCMAGLNEIVERDNALKD